MRGLYNKRRHAINVHAATSRPQSLLRARGCVGCNMMDHTMRAMAAASQQLHISCRVEKLSSSSSLTQCQQVVDDLGQPIACEVGRHRLRALEQGRCLSGQGGYWLARHGPEGKHALTQLQSKSKLHVNISWAAPKPSASSQSWATGN